MKKIDKVSSYLKQSGVFYLTTVDGNTPKCRPISFYMIDSDKLYFGIGTFKDVYRQINSNPNVEICACKDLGFLRYYGKAVFSQDPAMEAKALTVMPELKGIYNEETGNRLGIFSLEDAAAEFRDMLNIIETIEL